MGWPSSLTGVKLGTVKFPEPGAGAGASKVIGSIKGTVKLNGKEVTKKRGTVLLYIKGADAPREFTLDTGAYEFTKVPAGAHKIVVSIDSLQYKGTEPPRTVIVPSRLIEMSRSPGWNWIGPVAPTTW